VVLITDNLKFLSAYFYSPLILAHIEPASTFCYTSKIVRYLAVFWSLSIRQCRMIILIAVWGFLHLYLYFVLSFWSSSIIFAKLSNNYLKVLIISIMFSYIYLPLWTTVLLREGFHWANCSMSFIISEFKRAYMSNLKGFEQLLIVE
jgi:hypothetical protein